MFCQQDRAILCKECDMPIHFANEHTQKHSRFLLTGVKLSDAAKLYSSTPSNNNTLLTSNDSSCVLNSKNDSSSSSSSNNLSTTPISGGSLVGIEGGGSTSASSISEYLIETIPGWQVEDFLDSSSVPFGFSKVKYCNQFSTL